MHTLSAIALSVIYALFGGASRGLVHNLQGVRYAKGLHPLSYNGYFHGFSKGGTYQVASGVDYFSAKCVGQHGVGVSLFFQYVFMCIQGFYPRQVLVLFARFRDIYGVL